MHARARISGVLVGGGVPAWGSVPPTPAGGGQGPRVKAAVGDASSLLLRFLSSYVSGGSTESSNCPRSKHLLTTGHRGVGEMTCLFKRVC